jgi:hypothetical protein
MVVEDSPGTAPPRVGHRRPVRLTSRANRPGGRWWDRHIHTDHPSAGNRVGLDLGKHKSVKSSLQSLRDLLGSSTYASSGMTEGWLALASPQEDGFYPVGAGRTTVVSGRCP